MLAYERRGSGPTLVLLHTLGTDHTMWDPVLDRLAERRDTIALDMPGFGASPVLDHGSAAAPSDLAAAIARFLAGELGVRTFHVAGNSLGGWVALELAAAGTAQSVTAIAPAGLWPEPLMPRRAVAHRVARAALPLVRPLMAHPAARRVALGSVTARPELVPPAAARRLLRAYALAPGFDAANDAMRAGRFRAIADIAVPVTLAWPEHDRVVARPRNLPLGVRSQVLRNCGHLPTWDDPEAVAAVLLEGSGG